MWLELATLGFLQNLVAGGVLELLVTGLDHHDPVVMANCLWALMVREESLSCMMCVISVWVWFRVRQRGVVRR